MLQRCALQQHLHGARYSVQGGTKSHGAVSWCPRAPTALKGVPAQVSLVAEGHQLA